MGQRKSRGVGGGGCRLRDGDGERYNRVQELCES